MDPNRQQRLRTELARQGMATNDKLTRLLAGHNVTLATWPWDVAPGLKPEEKLRQFLDQIVRAQRRLGTEAWGHCVDCGGELPEAALDDTPWLERCGRCAA